MRSGRGQFALRRSISIGICVTIPPDLGGHFVRRLNEFRAALTDGEARQSPEQSRREDEQPGQAR